MWCGGPKESGPRLTAQSTVDTGIRVNNSLETEWTADSAAMEHITDAAADLWNNPDWGFH